MQLEVNGSLVDIEIVYKSNKNIYFRYKNNKLIVTCSKRYSSREVLKLVNDNIDSITKLINNSKSREESNDYFYYLGNKYFINFCDIDGVLFDGDEVFVKDNKILDKFYRDECVRIINERVTLISEMFSDIPEFSLKLRKMSTRWGVCNITKCNITINTELIKRDVHLLDYVIIHELCHFYEGNHSKRFWLRVSEYYPNYKLARKELRGVL